MKIFFTLFFIPLLAQATMTPNLPRGDEIVTHEVRGKRPEVCVVPKHLGDNYDKDDREDENELCAMDVGVNVAACAKTESTNPGVNFFTPPEGISIADMVKNDCEVKNSEGDDGSKEAKYKLSTSCSYTPSILGYYHVSRMLGNVANVPPAVLRTMDLDRHKKIAQRALATTTDLIHDTYASLAAVLNAGQNSPKRDLLLTDDFDQSYGALTKNPKHEEKYSELFNSGASREEAFRDRNPIFAMLKNPGTKVGRELNQKNVQQMVALRDVANMVLLDTILGQQDRFGNIHYLTKYFYGDQSGGKLKLKSEKKQSKLPPGAAAFAVKEMILKDNDCGVAKENRVGKARLLEQVAHIDNSTYKNLLALDKSIDEEETKKFFRTELMFTKQDLDSVTANIHNAARLLRSNCERGTLRLDLDVKRHFSNQPLGKYSCVDGKELKDAEASEEGRELKAE